MGPHLHTVVVVLILGASCAVDSPRLLDVRHLPEHRDSVEHLGQQTVVLLPLNILNVSLQQLQIVELKINIKLKYVSWNYTNDILINLLFSAPNARLQPSLDSVSILSTNALVEGEEGHPTLLI